MTRIVIISLALVLIICTTLAWANGRNRPMGPAPFGGHQGPGAPGGPESMGTPGMPILPPAGMISEMADELKLTEEQTAKLEKLSSSEDTIFSIGRQAAAASKTLHKAMLATDIDAKNVKELATAANKADAALSDARIDQWLEIRAILTACQVKQLRKPMGDRGPRPQRNPMGDRGPRSEREPMAPANAEQPTPPSAPEW